MPGLIETILRCLLLRSNVEPNIDRGVDDLESDVLGAEELKAGEGTRHGPESVFGRRILN